MKVKIVSVHNHGDSANEYVLLRVEEDCDIGKYVVADSTYTPSGSVSNKLRHMYWFPDKSVKKGEFISLRTGAGDNTTVTNDKGIIFHRFYWGLKTAIWNDTGDCAVLLDLNTWQFFKAKA